MSEQLKNPWENPKVQFAYHDFSQIHHDFYHVRQKIDDFYNFTLSKGLSIDMRDVTKILDEKKASSEAQLLNNKKAGKEGSIIEITLDEAEALSEEVNLLIDTLKLIEGDLGRDNRQLGEYYTKDMILFMNDAKKILNKSLNHGIKWSEEE